MVTGVIQIINSIYARNMLKYGGFMCSQYYTNEFLNNLVSDTSKKVDFLSATLEEFKFIKNEKIRHLSQLLKLEELDEKYTVDITYQVEEVFLVRGIEIKKYAVKIANHLVMPIYITQPANANGKTILYLHGHDSLGVKGAFTIYTNKEPYHKNIPLKMTEAGFRVVMPELFGYGEAVYESLVKGKLAFGECFFNYAILALCGYDLTALRVWQTMKVIDFMQLCGYNADVLFGVSGGGLICELMGALDDAVENIIISSYVNTYKDSILAKEQCIDNYIRGINQIGDNYELLALAAPKRMLLLNGTGDRPFPLGGTEKAFAYIKEIYKKYHAKDKLETHIFEGRHEINSEIVMNWLQQFQ